MDNSKLVEMTKDIVIAMIEPAQNFVAGKECAESVAESMQIIYDKLCELNKSNKINV